MKNMRKFFAIVLAIMILMGNVDYFQQKIKATSRSADEAINYVKSLIGQSIDKDGAYGAQCVDLILAYYDYLGVPRSSGNGADYTWNALPSGWQRIQGAQPQKGDILVYTGGTGNRGHVAIYEADRITYHQNIDGNTKVQQVGYKYNGLDTPYWGVIRPNWVNTSKPYFMEQTVQFVLDNNASVYTKIQNPGNQIVSTVGCRIYSEDGTLLKTYTEICGLSTSYVNYTCNFISDMGYTLEPGTKYEYQQYAIISGIEYKDNRYSFNTTGIKDNIPPTISNVQILSVNGYGYHIRCEIKDNIENGIEKIKFPTWTGNNEKDDLASDWQNNSKYNGTNFIGNFYDFYVNVSDYNNESGIYYTNIYAYDKSGNVSCYEIEAINVPEIDKEAPVISNVQITQKSEKCYYIDFQIDDMTLRQAYIFIQGTVLSKYNFYRYDLDSEEIIQTSSNTYRIIFNDKLIENTKYIAGEDFKITIGAYDRDNNRTTYTINEIMTIKSFKEVILKQGDSITYREIFGHSNLSYSYGLDEQKIVSVNIDENAEVYFRTLKPGRTIVVESQNKTGETKHQVIKVIGKLTDCMVFLKNTDCIYTGKEIEPDVTVLYDGEVLTEGIDYELKYSNNINSGIAKVKIVPATNGCYEGEIDKEFNIVKLNTGESNGKETTNRIESTKVEENVKTTESTTKPNQLVKPIENITQSTVVKKASATKIRKIKKQKKSLKIFWKIVKNINGYQIEYSTSSKFKKAKKITIKKAKKTSKTIKKLQAKKKYYVRIRTYIIVNGKKEYSNWSKKKSKKAK